MYSPSKSEAPDQTFQISYIIHNVKGDHIDDQAAVVCIDGETFLLEPRSTSFSKIGNKKVQTRYYESGNTIYTDNSDEIHFSVGIVTPNSRGKFHLHTFSYVNFKPSESPTLRKLIMTTPAQAYEITVSILTKSAPPNKTKTTSPTKTFSSTMRSSYQSSGSRLANTYSPGYSPKKSPQKSSPLRFSQQL